MPIERIPIEDSTKKTGEVPPQEVLLGAIESARSRVEIEKAGQEAVRILRELAERPPAGIEAVRERVESGIEGSPLFERIRRKAPLVVGIGGAIGIMGLAAPEGIEAAPRPQEVRPQEQKAETASQLTAEDRERAKQLAEHREIISGFLGKSGLALIDSLYQLKIESAGIGKQYGKDQKETARIAAEIERSITQISNKVFLDLRRDQRLTPERLKRIQDAIQTNTDQLLKNVVPLSRGDYNFLRAFSMKLVKEAYDVAQDRQRPNLGWERGVFAEGLLHRFSDRTAIRDGELYNGGILHDVDPFPAEVSALRRRFFTLQQISAEEYVKQLKQLIAQRKAPQELRLTPVQLTEQKLPDF